MSAPAVPTIALTAQAGDTLDALIWRERGLGPADLPAVLELNPGLADLGPLLPFGTAVLVPVIAAAPAVPDIVQLWD